MGRSGDGVDDDTAAPGASPPPDYESLESEGPPPLASHGWLERAEEVVAGSFFLGMIAVILIGIFWRYVLDNPLVWTINIATVCFIWAVFIGAPLSDWEDNHIQFDLLYNIVPAPVQLAMRTFGNLLLIVTFALILPATYSYLESLGTRSIVGAGWLRTQWAYAAILLFFILTIVQRARMLFIDLRQLVGRGDRGSS